MGSIIDKYWNGYKFTYMGDLELSIFGQDIIPGKPFYVPRKTAHAILNNITLEERFNFIYEKVLLSNYMRGDLSRSEVIRIVNERSPKNNEFN
jgi:hypothetical protein